MVGSPDPLLWDESSGPYPLPILLSNELLAGMLTRAWILNFGGTSGRLEAYIEARIHKDNPMETPSGGVVC